MDAHEWRVYTARALMIGRVWEIDRVRSLGIWPPRTTLMDFGASNLLQCVCTYVHWETSCCLSQKRYAETRRPKLSTVSHKYTLDATIVAFAFLLCTTIIHLSAPSCFDDQSRRVRPLPGLRHGEEASPKAYTQCCPQAPCKPQLHTPTSTIPPRRHRWWRPRRTGMCSGARIPRHPQHCI